ncbi:MAG TPA: YdeI/OmpD-associated family protein [Gemmatimonadaceae bacterium]|nr:YdeI/OmpD-associated family protein [Gemmatimonadaceae bacterium]
MAPPAEHDVVFFATPEAFRAWLAEHHQSSTELWVGFFRKDSGERSITWPEAVDEALCVGWIDGVRKRLDERRYVIRFTPRKTRSTWSMVNVARVAELTRVGRMRPEGLAAFEKRTAERTGTYTYEQPAPAVLDAAAERTFRASAVAWEFFQAQAPSYRRTVIGWVASAKREETRQKRLAAIIEASAHGRRL